VGGEWGRGCQVSGVRSRGKSKVSNRLGVCSYWWIDFLPELKHDSKHGYDSSYRRERVCERHDCAVGG
jgi:hypothetical protein